MAKELTSLLKKLYISKWLQHKLTSLVSHYIRALWTLLLSSQVFQSTRDYVWLSLHIALTKPPIEWQWQTTTIVVLLVLLVFETFRYFLYLLIKRFQKKYFFCHEYSSTFTWKVNKESGDVEKTPYCRIHKTKLLHLGDKYRCTDCGSFRVGHTSMRQINFEYNIVSSRAKAIIEGHYRRTPILPIRILQVSKFYMNITIMSIRQKRKREKEVVIP